MAEKTATAPNAPANPIVKHGEQPPMTQRADNGADDSQALIQEGLAAIVKAGGKIEGSKPTKAAPAEESGDEETAEGAEPEAKKAAAPKEEAPAETQTGPTAKGWAALKKHEAKLRQERAQLDEYAKQERFRLQQERDQVKAQASTLSDIKAAFGKDPFRTLKDQFGVTLNDLANMALADGKAPPATAAPDPEKAELLSRLDRMEKLITETNNQRHFETFKARTAAVLQQEEFSLLQTVPNVEQEIIEITAGYAQKTGEVLQPEKAAGILLKYWEDHLREKVGAHAAARRILGLPESEASGAPKTQAPPGKKPKKTLTNNLSSSPPAAHSELPNDLTDEDEIKLAAKLIPDSVWDRMS